MSFMQHNNLPEPDVLQLNMETISKELNDLIVAGEKESGISQQLQQPTFVPLPIKEPVVPVSNTQVTQYMMHYYQDPEQLMSYTTGGIQNMSPNLNHMATCQSAPMGNATITNNTFNSFVPYGYVFTPPPTYITCSNISSNSNRKSSVPPSSTYGSPPKYEFHYLRPLSEYGRNGISTSNITTARDDYGNNSHTGAYRKYSKPVNKHGNIKVLHEGLDYDKIVVDLSTLGWSNDGKEINPVLRLFALLRDLYNAIAEVPPSFEPLYETEYEPTFAPLPKCAMPCTMNVQYQVKQACRKLTIFVCDMQRILNVNKMYDRPLHAETERYLNNLRQLLNQFEMYKRIELEHKRGEFINEDVRVHAERLEILLEIINRQIREVHVRITAFDWFIGVKYRGQVRKVKSQAVTKDGQPIKRSNIGVINEILQLSNATNTTKTPANATETSAEMNYKEIAKKIKPQIKRNANILNTVTAAATGQTTVSATTCLKTASAVTFSARQPVFYIG